jgi:putative peptidoglycan lipid II flippase
VFKLVGGAVLVSIPTAVLLSILGKPAIYILFQHGAFTRHSSALTALALIGYAIGLPGQVALELLIRSFYALKNALIPLLTTLFAFAAHIGLILLLLKLMTGKYLVMAIPLAVASVATVEAGLLCLLLLWRLRTNKAGD